MVIERQIFYTFLILVFSIVLFGASDLDIYIQDMFYNFKDHMWIVNRDLEPWKFIFYDGIKKLLIFIGVVFLFFLLFFRNAQRVKDYKRGMAVVVLSAISIPLIVGGVKMSTNMPCPKNEVHYGGQMIKTAVWQSYAQPYKSMKHISCWPAGHASGGFALMSLYFLFKTKRNKMLALGLALSLGWVMGIYKMLIGDHFLSHTVITMLISWLFILMVNKPLERWVKN